MPDSLRGANRPVIRKLILALPIPSVSVSTSPGDTCSSAAADAGRAAGISSEAGGARAACERGTWLAAGAAGHRPDTRTAWLVTPSSAAASSSGVFPLPALAGGAGSEPGTRSSGSDHVPDQNPNGTPPSDRPTAVRSALAVATVWPLLTGPAIDSAVPGATDRSWRIASGSPWPTNTASAAPTAAATSVVSAAAASTTQCAVIRRVDRVPRGWITVARILFLGRTGGEAAQGPSGEPGGGRGDQGRLSRSGRPGKRDEGAGFDAEADVNGSTYEPVLGDAVALTDIARLQRCTDVCHVLDSLPWHPVVLSRFVRFII